MKTNQKWKVLGLCLLLPWTAAHAQVEVNVSGAQVAARPIAILPVQGDPGVKMDYIIASDLHKTGLFQPLDPKSFPENPASPAALQYPAWKQAGADYVVMGMMQGGNAGQFVLNDVNSASQLANENLHDADARQLAHQAADWILYRLTGKRGVFGTQLAYVLEQGGAKGARRYSLLVSDVDGANRREIYSSNEPILSPARQSPSSPTPTTTHKSSSRTSVAAAASLPKVTASAVPRPSRPMATTSPSSSPKTTTRTSTC